MSGHFATCPITQGSPMRLLIREGQPASAAQEILTGTTADPRHEFWPDDFPYTDVPTQGNHRSPPGDRCLSGTARPGPRIPARHVRQGDGEASPRRGRACPGQLTAESFAQGRHEAQTGMYVVMVHRGCDNHHRLSGWLLQGADVAPVAQGIGHLTSPRRQAAALAAAGARVVLVGPDRAAVHAIGHNVLDLSRRAAVAAAGRAQARAKAAAVRAVWQADGGPALRSGRRNA